MKDFVFIIVIQNIKNPNLIVSGGIKNKYKGAYKKIFEILNEDFVFVDFESEDEELIGNDFYLYFNLTPDLEKLERILKIPNVAIISQRYGQIGLLAPNDKPSNLNAEQYKLVRSEAFLKWFGDWENDPANASKVVDENGEPQVCYHGTFSENLNSFDEKKIGHNTGNEGHYGYGFYFSFDRIEASTYTYDSNPIILECFLNIRNPFLSSNLENLERYSNRYGYYEEKKPVAIDSEWLESELKKHKDQKPYLLYKSIKENGYEKGWELFLDKNKIDWDNETFDYNRINDWYEYDSSKEEFSKENEDENYNDEIPEYILENISEQLNVPLSEIKTIKQYTVGNYPSLLYMMDLGNRSRDLTDEIKQDGFDGIIAGSEIVLFKSNQIKLSDGTNTTFDPSSDDIRFEQGGEINEEAQQLIDIISMHPNLEKYQKYKVLLKDKFGIDFDLMYKDQEYIDNANLSDIKSQDDFFDFGNWLSYAKIISTKRGFVPMDSYWGRSEEMTDEDWNETADKLGFTVEKYNYEERGNNGGDVAYAFANKLFYTKEADLYYFLHEIGHIYDFQNVLTGIIKNPAYSPTNYGTTHSGETFAENFAIYFLNPTALKNWNEDVYYAMDMEINDKYKKELKKIVSEKSKFEKGGEIDFKETSIFSDELGNEEEFEFNGILVPKKSIYGWIYDEPNVQKKIKNGEYDLVKFRKGLNSVWEKEFQKEHKGSDKLIGIFKGRLSGDNKTLYLLTMTTKPSFKRKGVMSKLIETIRNKYNINKENIVFIGLTSNGRDFFESKKYEKGGFLAPNGNISNLNAEQYELVRTPAFKKWFGDWDNDPENSSKVVDENGEPLICYHGGRAKNINIFDLEKSGSVQYSDWGKGIYFTPSKSTANYYSNESIIKADKLYNDFYEVYEKTQDFEDLKKFQQRGRELRANKETIVYEVFLNIRKPLVEIVESMSYTDPFLSRQALEMGKDGVIILNGAKEIDELLVFKSNQIKLSDGTNTLFDSSNEDIRFAKGGELKAEDMLKHPLTIKRLKDLDDNDGYWVNHYHAKTNKYKPNTYYHLNTNRGLNAGVGKGLYLGRDKDALISFYDLEGENKTVDTYFGNPNWLDLIDYADYDRYEQEAIRKYGKNYVSKNSISDIDIRGEMLRKLAIEKGFDGIRYYDPQATGEEFVLFDVKKVKKIDDDVIFAKGGRIFNDTELLAKWKKGESIGFTGIAHLKSKGLIPRADGSKRKSEKYMENGGEIDFTSTKSINIKINNDLYRIQYQKGERGDTDKNVWFAKVIYKNNKEIVGRLCENPELSSEIYGFSLKEVESDIYNLYIENQLYLIIEDDYGNEKEIIHIEFSEKSKYEKGGEIDNFIDFYDELKIEDGSKYIGQKFGIVFPFLGKKRFVPNDYRISVKQYEGVLSRLEQNDYSSKIIKQKDLNKLERIKNNIDKKYFLAKFYLDGTGTIVQFKSNEFSKGGRTISQTPSPKKDQVQGSDINKKSSSKNLSSAKLIKFDAKTLNTIKNKVEKHNEENPNKKINLASAKAVVRRGMGAYSSSHRPTISNGLPNSRLAWGLARLNAFTYKIINGKSKSGKYKQDDDLIEELGFKVANYKNGGEMKKDIRCINCGWEWNKKDSELWDMYVCHKCGFDNTTFYTSIPVNTFRKGGETEAKNPNYLEMFLGK